jgi:hypothetical protein
MSSLSPVGRSAAAHQKDRAFLCCLTFSDGPVAALPATTHLKSTRTESPTTVDSKVLTEILSSLESTLTKCLGEGYKTLSWSPVTNHRSRFLGARTSVRSKSSCVSRRRMSFVRVPSISTSLGRVRAL